MYVIFPADEVVYLSYGRLIYVPQSPTANPQINTPTRSTATTSVEEYPQSSNISLESSNTSSTKQSRLLVPKFNQTASLDRKKLNSKIENNPVQTASSKTGVQSLRGTPELTLSKSQRRNTSDVSISKSHRGGTPEESVSKTFAKRGSGSNKSGSLPSTSSAITETEIRGTTSRARSVSESVHIENLNKPPILGGSLKVQKSIKERHSKVSNKSKTLKPEHLNLCAASCDDNKICRERVEIPRSEIINARSDQIQSAKSDKVRVKRENSFIRRLFNGQLSNSKSLENEKSVFDFDSLFKREKNSEKLSVSAPATPARFAELGRDTSGSQRNTQRLSVVNKAEDFPQGWKGRKTI